MVSSETYVTVYCIESYLDWTQSFYSYLSLSQNSIHYLYASLKRFKLLRVLCRFDLFDSFPCPITPKELLYESNRSITLKHVVYHFLCLHVQWLSENIQLQGLSLESLVEIAKQTFGFLLSRFFGCLASINLLLAYTSPLSAIASWTDGLLVYLCGYHLCNAVRHVVEHLRQPHLSLGTSWRHVYFNQPQI